jgi:hypothetical protein
MALPQGLLQGEALGSAPQGRDEFVIVVKLQQYLVVVIQQVGDVDAYAQLSLSSIELLQVLQGLPVS